MEGIFKNKKSEEIRFRDGVPQFLMGSFLFVTGILLYLLVLDVMAPSELNFRLSVISLFLIILFTVLFFFYYEKMKNFIRKKFIYDKTGYFSPLPLPSGLKITFFILIILFILFPFILTEFKITGNRIFFLIPHFLFLIIFISVFLYSRVPDFLFSFFLAFPVLFLSINSDIKFSLVFILTGSGLLISGGLRWMILKRK